MDGNGNHIIALDILKGVLIITVVVGHVYAPLSWLDVFWFHMPAFFIICGYATHNWNFEKENIRKKIVRLWIPYMAYCLMLLPFIPNVSVGRQILKFIIGGGNSTTCLTYPFWFANAMLMACIAYSFLKTYVSSKIRVSLICLIWFVIHVVYIPDCLPAYLPLGIDLALGAICYIEVGFLLKTFNGKRAAFLFVIIPFIFALCNANGLLLYRLNMMSMIYDHVFLDLLVPLSFVILLYVLCSYIEKCSVVSNILQYIGQASMSIMFMHVAIIYLCTNLGLPKYLSIVLGALLPVVANYFYNQSAITRLLFLGCYNDYNKIFK